MVVALIGLTLFAFAAMLLSMFFQLAKVEQLLDRTVETVEVYLLQEYGEVRTDRHVSEESIEDDAED